MAADIFDFLTDNSFKLFKCDNTKYSFKTTESVLKVLAHIIDDKVILPKIDQFFLMNVNPLMRWEKGETLSYDRILKKLVSNINSAKNNKIKVIISGTEKAVEQIITTPSIAKILLPMQFPEEINEDKLRKIYDDLKNEKNYKTVITLIDRYKLAAQEIIDKIENKKKDDSVKLYDFIPCYNIKDVPWFLFWIKFKDKAERSISIQALLDTKNISSVVKEDRFNVPGIISIDDKYNNCIKELCVSFSNRLNNEREFKKEKHSPHVVTISLDIIKWTRYSYESQRLLVEHLNSSVHRARCFVSIPDEQLIITPTGDGMIISVISKPDKSTFVYAFDFAREILSILNSSKYLDDIFNNIEGNNVSINKKWPFFPVRLGMYTAEDYIMINANGNFNPCGRGISNSFRIMNFAKNNHFLVHNEIYKSLSDHYKANGLFSKCFSKKDKNGEMHHFHQYNGNTNEKWIPDWSFRRKFPCRLSKNKNSI